MQARVPMASGLLPLLLPVARTPTIRLIEVADILGVTHQRASRIARGTDFPRPIGRQGKSRLWDRREVTAWAKVWRRERPWR